MSDQGGEAADTGLNLGPDPDVTHYAAPCLCGHVRGVHVIDERMGCAYERDDDLALCDCVGFMPVVQHSRVQALRAVLASLASAAGLPPDSPPEAVEARIRELRADVERLRGRTHEIQAQEMAKRAAMDSELDQWRKRWENAEQWCGSVGLTADWAVDPSQSFWRMTSYATRTALLRLVTERAEARVEVEALTGIVDSVRQRVGWGLNIDWESPATEKCRLLLAYLMQLREVIDQRAPVRSGEAPSAVAASPDEPLRSDVVDEAVRAAAHALTRHLPDSYTWETVSRVVVEALLNENWRPASGPSAVAAPPQPDEALVILRELVDRDPYAIDTDWDLLDRAKAVLAEVDR